MALSRKKKQKENLTTKGRRCYHCGNNSASDEYFSLPYGITRVEHRAEWLEFLNLKDPTPGTIFICSKHFCENDITITATGRRILKRDAKPSIQVAPCKKRKRKDGAYKCFYCEERSGELCYFLFPKDPKCFQKWVDFCEVAPEEILPSFRLCNRHFEDELITGSFDKNRKRSLQENAVPTIRTSTAVPKPKAVITSPIEVVEVLFENPSTPNLLECALPIEETSREVSTSKNTLTLTIEEVQATSSTSLTLNEDTLPEVSMRHTTPEVQVPLPATPPSPPRIPKHFRSIKPVHLSTPRRAKECFNLACDVINRKNRQIKTLQMQLRRCTKKIHTLTDMVKMLKKKKMTSEEDW